MAVKRGVADAARRLYTERAALRYDGLSRQLRMADVIELTHPQPRDGRHSALFRCLLDRRHHDDAVAGADRLPLLAAAATLEAVPANDRRSVLRERGSAALAAVMAMAAAKRSTDVDVVIFGDGNRRLPHSAGTSSRVAWTPRRGRR